MKTCIIVGTDHTTSNELRHALLSDEQWDLVAIVNPDHQSYDLQALSLRYNVDVCFVQDTAIHKLIGTESEDRQKQLTKNLKNTALVCFADNSAAAFDAVNLGMLDFLALPVSSSRLNVCYEKCETYLVGKKTPSAPARLIAVKSVGSIEIIDTDDILWVKGAANYAELHCHNRVVLHRETLANLENKLASLSFTRVHRSALINYAKIKTISSDLGRFSILKLVNGEEVKLSVSYKDRLFEKLGLA